MPTSTFFNLPVSKRERLLDAAVAEFAQKPFDAVSINRIIHAAGIPRGSFYQYFEDKTDLFRYVLHGYVSQVERVVEQSLERCGGCPLELPLTLYDQIISHIPESQGEFAQFLGILRQNIGMDLGQLLSLPEIMGLVLERADWGGLALEGRTEQLALLDLLLSSTGQALVAVGCGKLGAAEGRERLAVKAALIRRGIEIKEEDPC